MFRHKSRSSVMRCAAAFCLYVLLAASSSNAASILTQFFPNSSTYGTFTSFPQASPPTTVPGFDSSLGQLQSVGFRTLSSLSAEYSFDAPVAGGYTYYVSELLVLRDAFDAEIGRASSVCTAGPLPASAPGIVSFNDGNVCGTTLLIQNGLDRFLSDYEIRPEWSVLVRITGPDGFELDDFPDTATANFGFFSGGFATVEYSYVPEPGSALLVGLGLGLVAVSASRRST